MEIKPGLSALVTGGASGIGNFVFSLTPIISLISFDLTSQLHVFGVQILEHKLELTGLGSDLTSGAMVISATPEFNTRASLCYII